MNLAHYLRVSDATDTLFMVARTQITEPMPPIPTDAWMAERGFKRIYDHKPPLLENETYAGYTVETGPERVDRFWSVTQARPEAEFLVLKQAEAKAALAALRWEKETAGIVLGGVEVRTDRESQAQLSSAYTSLKSGLITSTDWKGANGWVLAGLAEIEPLAQAVAQHVAGCFATERLHAEAIDALTTAEAVAGYSVATGWP